MSYTKTVSTKIPTAAELRARQDALIAEKQAELAPVKKALDDDIEIIRSKIMESISKKIDEFSYNLTHHTKTDRRYIKIYSSEISKLIDMYPTMRSQMKTIYNCSECVPQNRDVAIIIHIMSEIKNDMTINGYTVNIRHQLQLKENHSSYQYIIGNAKYVEVLTHYEFVW
jgi:hypothetical protein